MRLPYVPGEAKRIAEEKTALLRAIATETRRAETTGSVEDEGAGRQAPPNQQSETIMKGDEGHLMSDLLERLRRGVTWSDGKPIGAVVGEVNDPIMREAAAEIERLKGEVEDWKRKTLAVVEQRDRLQGAREQMFEALDWAADADPQLVEQIKARTTLEERR